MRCERACLRGIMRSTRVGPRAEVLVRRCWVPRRRPDRFTDNAVERARRRCRTQSLPVRRLVSLRPTRCRHLQSDCHAWRNDVDYRAWLAHTHVASLITRPLSISCLVGSTPSRVGGAKRRLSYKNGGFWKERLSLRRVDEPSYDRNRLFTGSLCPQVCDHAETLAHILRSVHSPRRL